MYNNHRVSFLIGSVHWEDETHKQTQTRYKKYEKMADTDKEDKQSIRHQVHSMYKSIRAQENVITYLRGLETEDERRTDIIEEVESAHAELVGRMEFLTVAFDYD